MRLWYSVFDEIVLSFTCSPISSSGIMSSIESLLRVVSGVVRGFRCGDQ